MLIQSTQKLLDALKLDRRLLTVPPDQIDELYNWQANLVVLDRRKVLFLMNDLTHYPVILYRIKPTDLKRLDTLIPSAIGEAFRSEGIREEVIQQYLADSGSFTITKSSDRKQIAALRTMVRDMGIFWNQLEEDALFQPAFQLAFARYGWRFGGKFSLPANQLREALARRYTAGDQTELICTTLYQLKISLDIPGHAIWRRVQVPATFSFFQLHNIIQTVFDWMNYHLHQFEVQRKGEKDLLIVIEDTPDFTEFVNDEKYEIEAEKACSLDEVFSRHRLVSYEYDFGDSWDHIIELEKTIKADQVYPIFLEGQGERPPEDVGGKTGFAEYLRVISDPEDEEHDSMIEWAQFQGERPFSKSQINERLKTAYSSFEYYVDDYFQPQGRGDWDQPIT